MTLVAHIFTNSISFAIMYGIWLIASASQVEFATRIDSKEMVCCDIKGRIHKEMSTTINLQKKIEPLKHQEKNASENVVC